MDNSELYWVAGILEGEGCFALKRRGPKKKDGTVYKYPTLEVNMTDEDIIRRLQKITSVGNIGGPYYSKRSETYKPVWRWCVQKVEDSIVLMKLVYPIMGERRQKKIEEILVEYNRW